MSKPGRRQPKPAGEIALFTNRENERAAFHRHLNSAIEPPVLMFYGIGGAGKSWLLKKLREETPREIPSAFLAFDPQAGGQRFALDPAAALYDIRLQLAQPAPRFDLAFAMLRYKQGAAEEPGFRGQGPLAIALDVVAEVAQLPGLNVALKLGLPLLKRLKDTPLERFLLTAAGSRFILDLRAQTSQEIDESLLDRLADDLREAPAPHLDRAVRAVLFLDSFEALTAGLQSAEHRRSREQWVQDLASAFDFALTVIGGQDQLTWDRDDPAWTANLDRHLLGGLLEEDARRFLANCAIDDPALQAAILAAAHETDTGSYHCLSLGMCVDIVASERRNGKDPLPETLRFGPRDWDAMVRRFFQSLNSDIERRWIERLALTPRFDQAAARAAYSSAPSAAQDAEWDALLHYTFVHDLPGSPGWFAIRSQMRRALENLPSSLHRVHDDHLWWQTYWGALADAASLAWYHRYSLEPEAALAEWVRLAVAARTSVPPRMTDHFELLRWWEPLGLLAAPPSPPVARALNDLGIELVGASLGNRTASLRQAIACHEAALRVYTEQAFPKDWAFTQNGLGDAWQSLPTGDRAANLRQAIACYQAALRVYTEQDFPRDWAGTENGLGVAWQNLPTGDRATSLSQAIACYEAALRVCTERDLPRDWAMMQNNLGTVWGDLPTGDRTANLRHAIDCYEAALRVHTEQAFPQDWATAQNNLGLAWRNLPTGDRPENLRQAIVHCEAALRVFTEQDFPYDWAGTQNNLGNAWLDLLNGDRAANLLRAIDCYQAALRVYTEQDSPQRWALTQSNLANAWTALPTGNRPANVPQAIACCEAALRVYTEEAFPQDWAMTQINLGNAWLNLIAGDRPANLRQAIDCYQAALRVYTELAFPQNWALTQTDLGTAWLNVLTGDRAANLRQAIDHYQAALRVYTEQAFPQNWALTQRNLGAVWLNPLTGDPAANLRQAIDYYQAALRVYTEQDFPRDWALTQTNLGAAWLNLLADDRPANLRHAIDCYQAALRVYTEPAFPSEREMVAANLQLARQTLDRLAADVPPQDRP